MSGPLGTLEDGHISVPGATRIDGLLVFGSDHGALAEGWRRWGDGIAAHLPTGTFLVWDEETRRGVLSRGRSGQSPLLVARQGARTAFAADPGPLLTLLRTRPAPDTAGVARWLAHGAPPLGHTLLTGVRRLAPGHHLRLGPGAPQEQVHWEPRPGEPMTDPDEAGEALLAAVAEAVAAAAGEHDALLLSGGLDSTAVAALHPGPGPLALHGAFPGAPEADETAAVDATVRELGLRGVRALVETASPIRAAVAHTLRWHAPLPTPNDAVWVPLLERAAALGATRVLDGEGGDTVLGPAPFVLADLLRSGRPFAAGRAARRLVGDGLARRALWRFGLIGALPPTLHEAWRQARGAEHNAPSWLAPGAARALLDAEELWSWKRLGGPRWWAHRAHELTALLDASGAFDLPRRRAAAAALEARHPLLDPRLVDLALRLDPALLHDPARDRPLARDALRGRVPAHVLRRAGKAWFNPVQERWLLAERAATARLLGPHALIGEFVDLPAVREWALGPPDRHPGGRLRWPLDTWRVLAVELWLREHALPGRDRELLEHPADPVKLVALPL